MLDMTKRTFTCTCGEETDSVPRLVSYSDSGTGNVSVQLLPSGLVSIVRPESVHQRSERKRRTLQLAHDGNLISSISCCEEALVNMSIY